MPCNKKRTIVLIVVSAAADPGRLFLAAHYRGAPLRGLRPVPESLLPTHSITNHRCLRKNQRLSLPLLCSGISSSNICAICCFLLPSRTRRGTLVSSQIIPGITVGNGQGTATQLLPAAGKGACVYICSLVCKKRVLF